jgi:hypothetical protein
MHDTPRLEVPSAAEQKILDYAEALAPRPKTSPLAVEDPTALPKIIRLLKAHAKGPEAFDRAWKNRASSTKGR